MSLASTRENCGPGWNAACRPTFGRSVSGCAPLPTRRSTAFHLGRVGCRGCLKSPLGAVDFTLNTFVGDEWSDDRYAQRKSADFLASWVVTDVDTAALQAKLNSTAASVSAGFGWEHAGSPEWRAMTYSAYLLPPGARPTARDYAGLSGPDIIWVDERWWRFTEHTDLHEVRYLEVRHGDRAVALAPLLITPKPGGLLFYDPPRLAGTAGALAEPELARPSRPAALGRVDGDPARPRTSIRRWRSPPSVTTTASRMHLVAPPKSAARSWLLSRNCCCRPPPIWAAAASQCCTSASRMPQASTSPPLAPGTWPLCLAPRACWS